MRRRCWAACRQMMATSSAMAFRAATTADDDGGFDEELLQIGGVDDSEAVEGPLSGNPLLFFRETVKLFIIKTSILRRCVGRGFRRLPSCLALGSLTRRDLLSLRPQPKQPDRPHRARDSDA